MNDPQPNNEDQYTDSIVHPGQHFRLKMGHDTVGYMNVREEGGIFYSKDNSSWSKTIIPFDGKDRSAGIYDANRQMIFENDLVKLRKEAAMNYTKRGLVVWNSAYRGLVIKLLEEDGIITLDVPSSQTPFRDDLTVLSHLS
jgi:hypothetical protein